jgi:hypothetical protein
MFHDVVFIFVAPKISRREVFVGPLVKGIEPPIKSVDIDMNES